MNNFEERKEEIFRRASAMSSRRRRNFYAAGSAALCLCAAVIVAISSEFFSVRPVETTPVSLSLPIIQIYGADGNEYLSDIGDEQTVLEAVGLLDELLSYGTVETSTPEDTSETLLPTLTYSSACPEFLFGSVTDAAKNPDALQNGDDAAEKYVIEFTDRDGKTRGYTLDGSLLTDSDTEKNISLDNSELDKLLEMLGLKK